MKKILLLLALLCAGFATPAFAQACTTISSLPYTISASGNYCLTANHTVNMVSGSAITVDASDVVLDCKDFIVRNNATNANGSSNGVNIASEHAVTVKNCRIMGGFTNGIRATQNNSSANVSYYNTIVDNYIAGPYWHGIYAYGSGIEIRDNRVYDIGGQANNFAAGIRIGASTLAEQPKFFLVRGNLIAGTNSPNNNAYGILGDNPQASIIIENATHATYSGNPAYRSYGVRLLAGTYNRITDNHVVGPGTSNDTGIQTADGTSSCYDNYLRVAQVTVNCDASMGNE